MKKFTKSLLTLVLLVLAVSGAKAQTETDIKDLKAANGTTEDWVASIPASYPFDVKDAVAFGSDANSQVTNANVNKYDYVYFEVTNFASAHGIRIFFWDTNTNSRKDWFIRPVEGKEEVTDWAAPANVTGNGTYCVKIPAGARLQGAKTPWTSSPTETAYFQFSKIYVIEPADPLAGLKDLLQQAIDKGKVQTSFAKTTASWNTLQNAISDGEEELKNDEATEKSLTDATTAINNAIAGLKLQDGYTNLTSDMFKAHASTAIDAAVTGAAGCSYVINEASDLPYGDGSVGEKNWADLAEFSQFIAVSANDIPRFCMNRMEAGANHNDDKAEAKFIDIKATEPTWWEVVDYLTIDEGKYSVDLNKVVDDFGVARLHCIKGKAYAVKTTLTDMLLYRTVTVGATGYATFGSVSKNAKFNDGVTAYAVTYTGGKTVSLAPVTTVSAGKGVIIEAEAGEYAPTFDVEADETASDMLVSNGTVVGDGSTIYVLNKVNDKLGFYLLKAGEKLEAGKAYLVVPANSEARGFIGFDGATGINEVNVNKAAAKTGKIYNLNGQIVSKPSKGLFIVDGKVVSF